MIDMQSNKAKPKTRALTVIELLTVMSIIDVLIGLLVPALNQALIYNSTDDMEL